MLRKMSAIAVFVSAIGSATSAQEGLMQLRNNIAVQIDISTVQSRKGLPLCARHLNFWCIKTPGNVLWNGQVAEDSKKHAVFDNPEYSARAFFKLMWTYRYRYGLNTANQIFGRYAPVSDCIGSVARNPKTGLCPTGENPTWVYARNVAEALDVDPEEPINLFIDRQTVDREVAIVLARAMATFELGSGYTVTEALVDAGIKLSGFSSVKNDS